METIYLKLDIMIEGKPFKAGVPYSASDIPAGTLSEMIRLGQIEQVTEPEKPKQQPKK